MKILTLVWLLFITACLEKKPGTAILTSGIYDQALFSINNQDASGKTIEMGEHLLTNPPIIANVRVYNGTDYPYTELDLEFLPSGEYSSSTNYLPTEEGSIEFPGQGGNCTRTLRPKESCIIVIEVNPREERIFNEQIKLSYKHYVELEEHIATISFLAGMPASLIFTNDQTQYIFGTPAGPNNNPVVERADSQFFEEEIEIKNMGGLTAQNLTMSLLETCSSTLTSQCPTGMFGAYRLEHNCPSSLAPQESCQAKVLYQPLNKNPESGPPPADIVEINYRATMTAAYQTDSTGKTAAINAYFNSVSTDIQAQFTTTNKFVSFDQEVVSGNRENRFINIRNVGYRTGYLNSISIHDQSNAHMADCLPSSDSSFLQCVDASQNPVPLSTLPFRIKDRHGCLSTEDNKKEIAVAQSCTFDIFFQPSVTFLTPKTAEFQGLNVHATYDALWKAETRIIKTYLSSLSGKSISHAQIVVDKIRFDGEDAYVSDDGLPSLADLGRLPLQAPGYGITKNVLITFKNIGNTRATNIQLRDGSNRSIPIGGSGINLGAKAPFFYQSLVANDTNCTIIEPSGQCTISMNFAPVGMGSAAEEDANMFDSVDSLLRKIKSFILTYNSGALYTDENIDGPPDYPRQMSEAQLTAHLIRKGRLMELHDDNRNIPTFGNNLASINDEVITYLFLRNIGTGSISYIQALNPPIPNHTTNPNESWSLIPTADPQSLGADYDCLDIVDTNLTSNTNGNVDPDTRIGLFQPLETTKSCVYTIRIKHPDSTRHMNASSCSSAPTRAEDAARLYYRDGDGTPDLWEVCRTNSTTRWNNIRFRYFDGDTDAVSVNHENFGNVFSTQNFTMQYMSSWSKKLIFYSYTPFLTATAYRPSFTLPDLGTGNVNQQTKIIPEAWFFGTGTLYFSAEAAASVGTYPFLRAGQSRYVAQSLPSWNNRHNYDYIYYLGSFPKNSGIVDFAPNLKNDGSTPIRITKYTHTNMYGVQNNNNNTATIYRRTTVPALPSNYAAGGGFNIGYRLNTNTAALGEHTHEVEIEVETGEHEGPVYFLKSPNPTTVPAKKKRTLKFLMVANIADTTEHPEITAEVINYEITSNEGAPPTVTAKPPVPQPLTWNYVDPTTNIIFESVKIPGVPTANDPYDKKTIILRNNTAHAIQDLNFRFRTNITATSPTTIPSSFGILGGESTCVVGATIAPGGSCTLTYRYRPLTADTTQNYLLTFVYRSAQREYFMQNMKVTLTPRSPGKLIALEKNIQTINYKPSPTGAAIIRDSYQIEFPTTELTAVPTEINFANDSGLFKKIELRNEEQTKTSLLLAYQKYLTQNELKGYNSANPAGSSVVPDEDEYIHDSINSIDYVTIFLNKYSNGDPRLRVEASRGCLFGDDENDISIPSHQKGFNIDSSHPCFLRFYLKANFDYLNKEVVNTDGDAMRENAFELWYYSVNRSSSAYTWFHLTGRVILNSSYSSGSYDDVVSLDNRQISFSTPNFTPSIGSLGSVTGIRVYMSNNKANLNNLYISAPDTYFDIRSVSDGKWFANFTSSLQNGHFYYFKAVAIRRDVRFIHTTERFPGLAPGEYISIASTVPTLEVVVPPLNHYYVHTLKAVINKNIQGSIGSYTWVSSYNACDSVRFTFKTPDNLEKKYELINFDVWEAIKGIPTAHSYSSHMNISHWLSDDLVQIVDYLAGAPGFNPSSSSQVLEDIRVFYMKDPSNPSSPVRVMAGGVPGTGYSDFTSLIPPSIPFGNARCMISLE